MTGTVPEELKDLLDAQAYPHAAEAITLIETHISWVLLAGEFAYKIKRPLRLAFVDQRSLEQRHFLCREELRLNRRFAPSLYLDVVGIALQDGRVRIGAEGTAIEYAVRMRRFERADELDRLLESRDVETSELAQCGEQLAALQAGMPRAEVGDPWGSPAAIRAIVLKNFEELRRAAESFGTSGDIEALRAPLLRKLDSTQPWLELRYRSGFVREGHGDLHCRNLVRIDGQLLAFDCIEFEPAFRWIDVVDEAALLLVDLVARGWPRHAHAFWSGYLQKSGDYEGHRGLDLYEAHRALVRAKVAALTINAASTSDESDALRDEHRALLRSAGRALAARQPLLLLIAGVSGSGKTWLAQRLAPALQLIHVRSDVERKRLGGVAAAARSHSELRQGLYSPAMTEAVYTRLCACAEAILAGGHSALIDATFSDRRERQRFEALAARLGVRIGMIHCHTELAVLRARLAARQRGGTDPSEADEGVLAWQLQYGDPLTDDERIELIELDSSQPDLAARAQAEIRRRFAGELVLSGFG